MKNKALFGVVAVILLTGSIFAVVGLGGSDNHDESAMPSSATNKSENIPQAPDVSDEQLEDATATSAKTFSVGMSNFEFSEESLSVSAGDTVTINLSNSGGTHDFVIDEFNVQSDTISSGDTTSVTFTIPQDASGVYEFYCSVGNHRQLGMVGTLKVE